MLVSILKLQDVKVDFEAVANELSTDTITCTPRAVQEQLKKLKKVARKDDDGPETGKDGATPNAKPKTTTPASKRKTAIDPTDAGTPTKKGRKHGPKPTGVKSEKDDEYGADLFDGVKKEEAAGT